MDRQSRTRAQPPLSHGHDISNNAQAVQSQNVLTKPRRRSLSRSRIVRFVSGSAVNLMSSTGGVGSASASANPSDEQPSNSNRVSFSKHIKHARNRIMGSKAEGLGPSSSAVSANASQPASRRTRSTGSGSSNDINININSKANDTDSASPASDDDCDSVILDTSNEPLPNGSSKQVAHPAAPPPIPSKVKQDIFVPEPPPPIASYSSDGRQVQQPMGRSVPMKPVSENAESLPGKADILEPPPPVRSAVDARPVPRNSLPRTVPQTVPQKQLPPTPGKPSGLSLSGATMVAIKFKKLRRASSKRSANSASADSTTVSGTTHTGAPPAAVGSEPPSRVNSFPTQQQQPQTTVQKPIGAPTLTTNSGNANIPPPPPPIHSRPNIQVASWEDHYQQQQRRQQQQYQLVQVSLAQQHFSQTQPQPQDPQRYNNAIQDPYQYASAVEAELNSVRQQCVAQVSLLHQRDAQIVALSDTVERLRKRMQDHLQQQFESGQQQRSVCESSGGLYGTASASLPDSQVRSRWTGLRWKVRQCVETSVDADPLVGSSGSQESLSLEVLDVQDVQNVAGRTVSPTRAAQLRRLSPNYATLLQSRTGTVCLIEAALWTVLAQHVFGDVRRSSPMCWAPPPWKALTKINDNLLCTRPTDAAFHQWRAQTATFVADLLEQSKETRESPYVDEVVRQLEVEVGALLAVASGRDNNNNKSPHPRPRSADSAGLRRQLFDIVAAAVALDFDLCQQRAWFYVHFPLSGSGKRYGMPLDPNEMVVVEQDEVMGSDPCTHNTVSLVVRPALFKAGNSRGEAYDEVKPIEHSVVCRGPAAPRSSRSSPQPLSRR